VHFEGEKTPTGDTSVVQLKTTDKRPFLTIFFHEICARPPVVEAVIRLRFTQHVAFASDQTPDAYLPI